MKKKNKVSHPNKIGVVGPKFKNIEDKKEPIRIYKQNKHIEQLGGIEQVKTLVSNYFDSLLKKV